MMMLMKNEVAVLLAGQTDILVAADVVYCNPCCLLLFPDSPNLVF